jgi:hypothetical protein
MVDERPAEASKYGKWTKRAGIITFLFFLGKGLVWLGVALAGAYFYFD